MPIEKKTKVGRNDPCPCNSGRKYKKCHGALSGVVPNIPKEFITQKLAEMTAKKARQASLQGHSKPIISVEHSGYRFVAVRNKLHYSDRWKTFHDFIFAYMGIVLGERIGNDDLRRPKPEQHPISQWYQDCCAYQQKTIKVPGQIQSSEMIGVYAQYMWLSYSLYLMEHNQKLQDEMIKRLLNKNQFWGAVYEANVLGRFILAGFEVDLEDESDPTSTHVEFVATHKPTGKKYAVEAKARQPGKLHTNISNQLYKALKKQTEHDRVIFIDLNVDEHSAELSNLDWPKEISATVKEQESKLMINGSSPPPAYIIVSNHHYNTRPKSLYKGSAFFALGFKIPSFSPCKRRTLSQLVKDRERHQAVHDLIKSLKEHSSIPSTFDDEIPEFTYSTAQRTFNIGQPIHITLTPDGSSTLKGMLEDAIVIEQKNSVTCIVKNDSGSHIVDLPLTNDEMAAYRAHPDTFFGIYRKVRKGITHPLEAYDFFYESYKDTPKEKLLNFLKSGPEIESYQDKSQKELANIYCIRMAEMMISKSGTLESKGSE
jgi:uncharacterized protein YchJ